MPSRLLPSLSLHPCFLQTPLQSVNCSLWLSVPDDSSRLLETPAAQLGGGVWTHQSSTWASVSYPASSGGKWIKEKSDNLVCTVKVSEWVVLVGLMSFIGVQSEYWEKTTHWWLKSSPADIALENDFLFPARRWMHHVEPVGSRHRVAATRVAW